MHGESKGFVPLLTRQLCSVAIRVNDSRQAGQFFYKSVEERLAAGEFVDVYDESLSLRNLRVVYKTSRYALGDVRVAERRVKLERWLCEVYLSI